MIGLLQRVSQAEVRVDDRITGAIGTGLMVLVGVERGDAEAQADRLLERLLTYRVFPDEDGRMNRSLQDIRGGLLLGDILVTLDGQAVEDGEALQALLGGDRVGRAVTVEVLRGGVLVTLTVTVGQRPGRRR